ARCRSGGVAFSVLVHTDMSSPWLTRYGTEAQKAKYLPGIIAGDTVCALGITEPGTGSDMAALTTRAVRDGDRYLVTGNKIFITNGVHGDLYFVAARTAPGTAARRYEGISMFLVERDRPGFVVSRKLDKLGMRAQPKPRQPRQGGAGHRGARLPRPPGARREPARRRRTRFPAARGRAAARAATGGRPRLVRGRPGARGHDRVLARSLRVRRA